MPLNGIPREPKVLCETFPFLMKIQDFCIRLRDVCESLGVPFENIKEISKTCREQRERDLNHGLLDTSLFYGEVDPAEFISLLQTMPCKGKFYDLGSGAGKAICCAWFVGSFDSVVGIEILGPLVEISQNLINALEITENIRVIQEDICSLDWSDGDFIFMHSTSFTDELLKKVVKLLKKLKNGSTVVSVSQKLESVCLDYIQTVECSMTWGNAQLHIYRRNRMPSNILL